MDRTKSRANELIEQAERFMRQDDKMDVSLAAYVLRDIALEGPAWLDPLTSDLLHTMGSGRFVVSENDVRYGIEAIREDMEADDE